LGQLRRGAALVTVVAGVALSVLPVTAHAADEVTLSLPLARAAWFWDKAQLTAAPPEVTVEVSGVPGGSVAVAWQGGAEGAPEKEAYLALDLVGLGRDSQLLNLIVRAPLNADGRNQQPSGGPAPLVGCVPTSVWSAVEGAAFADKPQDDCSTQVKATYDAATTSYVFEVTALASRWRESNLGLAIRPPVDQALPAEPFQLVFDPKAVTATAVVVDAASATEEPPPPLAEVPAGPVAVPRADPPPLTLGFDPPRNPVVETPAPAPSTTPDTSVVTPVANKVLGPSGIPAGTLALVILAALTLVVVVAWVTGDARYALATIRAWNGGRGG
jgi:hypothetical protein